MRICGLDPSLTNTGIAILDCEPPVYPVVQRVQPVALHSIGWEVEGGQSFLHRNRRGRAVASSVMQYVIDRSPDLVVLEAPIPRMVKGGSQFDRWFLFELLLAECDIRKLEHVIVNPRTRQAWATGNGNAGKEEILEEVRRWWPVKILNSDIADACVLACMAGLRYGYPMPFSVKQRHWTPLLEKIVWPASAPAAPEQPEQLRLA